MIKLFIDAGHGGNDPGAVANGMRESDINFEVSKKLAEILRNSDCGFDIMLSRPTTETNPRHPLDNGKSVNARAIMSNEWGADYLISIHTNAAGGTGAELFFWEDTATVRKFSKSVLDTYCKHLALRNRRNEATNRWGVIRLTKCPAILFELAFIDSPAHNPDVNILRYKRDEMAEALAVGICKYFGKKFSLPSQGFDSTCASKVHKAINILHKHGVINSPDYWRQNYSRLKYLDELLINTAEKLEELQARLERLLRSCNARKM